MESLNNQELSNSISKSYNSGYIDTVLIWCIALCSVKIFTFLVPFAIAKGFALAGSFLVIILLAMHIVYGKRSNIKKNFHIEIALILAALLLSAFAAEFFNDQSALSTIFYQYEFYMIFLYYLIHRIKPDPDKLLNVFLGMGYLYAAVYFLQYMAYPAEIVSSRFTESRGSVRINMPGSGFMFAGWFILLSRFFEKKDIKYIIALIPFIIVTILLASRQVLASMTLFTLLNILLSKQIKSKVLMYVVIALAIIPFYFLFQDVFNQIFEVTQRQQANMGKNVRLLASRYFLFDLNHNPLWILTGNGNPAPHSEYGDFLIRISDELGFYQSDVGIIGDFSKFGILFGLAEVIFLLKLVFYKVNEKYSFMRYFALASIMTIAVGAGMGAESFAIFCLMFYIVDIDKQNTSKT